MGDGFNAYHVWLGIPPSEQPPHHYRLLAIAPFETSPEVIENAAERQMAHVRRAGHGKHSDASQRLLNEIAAAQRVLLNQDLKQAYDAALRQKLGVAASGLAQTSDWSAPVVHPPGAASAPSAPPVREASPQRWKSAPDAPPPITEATPAAASPLLINPSLLPAQSSGSKRLQSRAKRPVPVVLLVLLALGAMLPVFALLAALAMFTGETEVATTGAEEPSNVARNVPDDPPLPRVGQSTTPTSPVAPPNTASTEHALPAPAASDSRDPFDDSPSFGRTSGKPVLEETLHISARTLLPRLAFLSLPAEARTPIEVKAGQIVRLKIDGAWRIGPGGDQVRDTSALFIAVGHAGQPATQFAQGAPTVEFNVQKDGWLFMGIEDLFNFDNSGEMTVDVSVY